MSPDDALEANLRWRQHLPQGWHSLYERLVKVLAAEDPEAIVAQAKQKFGELRVYVDGSSGNAGEITSIAIASSRHTCEECGRQASLARTAGGYYATLCLQHCAGRDGQTFEPVDKPPMMSFSLQAGRLLAADDLQDLASHERPDLVALFCPAE